MTRVGASAHLKLAETRGSWVLGTRLAVHNDGAVVDMCCHVLLEGSIGTKSGGSMVESKQRIHLSHDFDNLFQWSSQQVRSKRFKANGNSGHKPQGTDGLPRSHPCCSLPSRASRPGLQEDATVVT